MPLGHDRVLAGSGNAVKRKVTAARASGRRPHGEPSGRGERAPAERAQHGATLATVNGVETVRDAVAELLAARAIGPAEQAASERWYRDYALAIHGARDAAGGMGGGGASGWMDVVVAARTSYDAARAAVGYKGDELLRAYVGDGLSIHAMAGKSSTLNNWLSGYLVSTLHRLVDHYHERDNTRPRRARSAATPMATV